MIVSKNSKISEGTEKTWLFHKIAQNGPKMLIEGGFSGVKFNSKTFLFSAPWPKNAFKGLKIEVFEKH